MWQIVKTCMIRLQVIEDPNMHDQIVFCAFHSFFSGSPNECWLHTYDECVITTWRLGLQVTRGASENALSKRIIVITLAQHFCALKQVVLRKQKQTWTATLTFALFQLFLRQWPAGLGHCVLYSALGPTPPSTVFLKNPVNYEWWVREQFF